MNFKTTDLCDACAEVQVCELPFVGFGRRRGFAGSIRTARYRDGIAVDRCCRQAASKPALVNVGTCPGLSDASDRLCLPASDGNGSPRR